MGTKKYPGILAIKGRDRNLKGRMSGGKVVNTKKTHHGWSLNGNDFIELSLLAKA